MDPAQPVPVWATAGRWWSASRSESELSLVCEEALVPSGVTQTGPWRALVIAGPLSHDLVGVLATVSVTLAMAEIPIFAISTFDTDWLLVPAPRLAQASSAFRAAGHIVDPEAA
ncbi:MAG: ACT domain-containing protein [Candidatus Dormiibacterota bacterium]